ncbi:MAG: MerR family transcriptional regulator [Candidatus Kryptonium sp.]|nr:MerR family transcriptional regulator [Candidatus Kryptonium sp.]
MLIKDKFSITDLEIATGIKSHTIRIWEKRYKLLNPRRGKRNIRYYNINDFRKFLNIATLYHQGLKISKIAQLSRKLLKQKIDEIAKENLIDIQKNLETTKIKIISSIIELNISELNRIIDETINIYGFETTFEKVLIPVLEKIGLFWQSETICAGQEHLFSNIIRDKIIKLEKENISADNPRTFLLFLWEDELHEIGLLFARFIIKSYGHKVIYLGQATPIKDVILISQKISEIDYVLTSFVSPMEQCLLKKKIKSLLNSTKKSIIVIGKQAKNLKLEGLPNLYIFVDISDFKNFIANLK